MSEKEKKLTSDWIDIQEANSLINTIELKGKQYAEVKERVIAFRRVHPLGQIITDLTFTENYVNCEATIVADNVVLSKGHSREYLKNDFAIERAETSAVGRALGFCGFGISTAIASAEDMQEVDKPSEIFNEPPIEELAKKVAGLLTKQELTDLLNCVHRVDLLKVPSYVLMSIIKHKEDEKHSTN